MMPGIHKSMIVRNDDSSTIRLVLPCRRRADRCFTGNVEPELADLLSDPILQRLLSSDGVHREQLIDLIAEVQGRLACGPAHTA